MASRMSRNRTQKLDLRLSPEEKETIYAAAAAAHRSVSEFVLESALNSAEQTLVDRRRFGLDADQWTAFLDALDAPPRELPRLQKLMEEPSPFEISDDR